MSELTYQVVERLYDNGLIREKVHFLEGETSTKDELRFDENGDDIMVPVTRFRADTHVETNVYEYEAS